MLEFRTRRGRVLLHSVLILMTVPFVYPFVAMIVAASGTAGLVTNLVTVATRPEVPGFFLSSAVIAAGSIVLSYSATMLAAFALALLRHRGKALITYVLVAALTLPTACLVVPLFYVVNTAGLYDNWAAVIVPVAALTVPFNIILARGFMQTLPKELFEAAAINGAGMWQSFRHIALPLCRPITAVIIVWTFVAAWNEYLLPLIFLQDPSKGRSPCFRPSSRANSGAISQRSSRPRSWSSCRRS